MRKWLYLMLAAVLLVSTFGISGCGASDSTGNGSFLTMLKVIPDTPYTRRCVYVSNHARIREIYDISLPSPDADDGIIEEYILMLLGDVSEVENDPSAGCRLYRTSFISGFGYDAFKSPIRRHNIGFGPQDVDMDIRAGLEPMVFEAIKGNYDLADIEESLSRYDESVLPDVDSYRGIKL